MKILRYFKLLYILAIITLFGGGMLYGQPCLQGYIKFSNQNQIDSFPILYPDCIEIEGAVDITSDSGSITNLLGLSAITSIEGSLRIFTNPELEDLAGLGNLQSVDGWLYIGNNDILSNLDDLIQLTSIDRVVSIYQNSSLESLSGLDNIEFAIFDYLEIIGNPLLSYCSISSICQHLSRYGAFRIYNNGPGCKYMEDIYNNCPYGPDSLAQYENLCFEEGFENWNISGDSLWPNDWTIEYPGLWISGGEPNVERVTSLTEGNFAILLRSNGPGFEGPERTIIERQLCDFPSRIDIAFTYTCQGDGYCEVILGQSSEPTGGVNLRSIWNGHTQDTIKRTVVLNNIPVNPPFSGFQTIQLRTNPVYWTGGSWGISEFTIDSLVVREYSISTGDAETLSESSTPFTIYPNPSHDIFYIQSNKFETPDLITVYTVDGQILLQRHHDNNVDLSSFFAGIYILEIQYKAERIITKLVKI